MGAKMKEVTAIIGALTQDFGGMALICITLALIWWGIYKSIKVIASYLGLY